MKIYKEKNTISPGITRFASYFLKYLAERRKIKVYVLIKRMEKCKWSNEPKGIGAYLTTVNGDWHSSMALCKGNLKGSKKRKH